MDVLITASSRPQCLVRTMDAFLKHIKYSKPFRFIIHEDFVFRKQSVETLRYIRESGLFHEVMCSKSPIGLGRAIVRIFPKVKTKYVFYLQDDWEFERSVNLDDVVGVMDNYPDINQIFFNKYKTLGVVNGFHFDEREVHPINSNKLLTICLNNGWQLLPAVWRTAWMMQRYRWYGEREQRPEGHFTNKLGSNRERMNPNFCAQNIGSYIWGKIKEYRYLYHLGNELRMASWRLEKGKPGGSHPPDSFDEKAKHPDVPMPVKPPKEGY